MGNNFASHGLRDEAAYEQRDVGIRQARMGERPDENEIIETKSQKPVEGHNGATNAGLEASDETKKRNEETKKRRTKKRFRMKRTTKK